MTFLKSFLICTFTDPNLAEKITNLVKIILKIKLHRVPGVLFFQVWQVVASLSKWGNPHIM